MCTWVAATAVPPIKTPRISANAMAKRPERDLSCMVSPR